MSAASDILDRVAVAQPPPFALLCRPESAAGQVDVLVGETVTPATLAEVPVRPGHAEPGHEVLVLVPYRQIAERGFSCVDDRAPLIAIQVTEQAALPKDDVLARLPSLPITMTKDRFEPDDESYAKSVQRVIAEEIGAGLGANFVIKRSFVAEIEHYEPRQALSLFRRLCERESGAYWTFVVHTGDRMFVGAPPERHVSLRSGVVTMNPVSGTYRYPASGPTLAGLLDFLGDGKEIDELYMVVDEELKMLSRICPSGGRVVGPHLKEMARLAHTGYLLEGRSARDPREILRETMFAPTVTGSPLESACRVIKRHEHLGRGYYSGVAALIGGDGAGNHVLDSAILIRTAEIDHTGRLDIGVGATIVRHSDPESEAAETRAKAAGLLAALGDSSAGAQPAKAHAVPRRFGAHPAVRTRLEQRNAGLARFWMTDERSRAKSSRALDGLDVLVVDAEDAFTAMIEDQIRALGGRVRVRRFDEYHDDRRDLVIMGPGPGDPGDETDPRIAHLRSAISSLVAARSPFLAVCLSHQVLCLHLGLDLVRAATPTQGTRRRIDLFGSEEKVAFYNSFFARSERDVFHRPDAGRVEVSRDRETAEVYALRARHFSSMQFHSESILTENGPALFAARIKEVLGA